MQRQMLTERTVRTNALIAAVDAAIARLEKGEATMTKPEEEPKADMFTAWREFRTEDYDEEAKQRWGDTEAYKISKQRTAGYTKQDWEKLGQEAGEIYKEFAALMAAGTAPDSPAAMDAAERHRLHITQWFYPCAKGMHRGLGELYVNDPRFTANIDRFGAGMSRYMCEAFRANSER
jgi:MerR family transcriptional regulator, thiopeptide resistance regulator